MLPEAKFRIIPLLTSLAISILLFVTWKLEVTGVYWDRIDTSVFFFLNGTLNTDNELWKLLVSFSNTRLFNLFSGLIILAISFSFVFSDGKKYILERLSVIALMIICYAIASSVIHFVMLESRQSPSLVLQPVYYVNDLITFTRSKYASGNSFPSDHATILLTTAIIISFYARRTYGILMTVVAVLFCFPRLIVGAHWFTDQFVGSLSLALVVTSIIIFTPLHYYIIKGISKIIETPYNFATKVLKKIYWKY